MFVRAVMRVWVGVAVVAEEQFRGLLVGCLLLLLLLLLLLPVIRSVVSWYRASVVAAASIAVKMLSMRLAMW